MSKKTTPATAAEAAVKELTARLTDAQTAHGAAATRHQELKATAQRITETLSNGSGDWSEDELIESRQRLEAAAAIAEAKRRGVAMLETQLNQAKGNHIAECIRAQAGGYASWEQLDLEVKAVTVEFIRRLDAIADRAEERNAFLWQAAEQLRQIDGGHGTDGDEVAGLRRRVFAGERTIEMDDERLVAMPASAVFETAVEEIATAGIPSVRYERQQGQAAAAA